MRERLERLPELVGRRVRTDLARTWVLLVAVLAIASWAHSAEPSRSQAAAVESVTLAAEVVAVDPAERRITLRGPLGGELEGTVADDVEGLDRLAPGMLVSATYYQAVAASVQREGEAKPLFTAADAAARTYPDRPAEAAAAVTETFTVAAVDPAAHSVTLRDSDDTLFPIEVERPEFAAKLDDLRVGDQVEVTYSEAFFTGVEPVTPGQEADVSMEIETLVVDNGTVLRRVNNTLLIRNDRGRVFRVTVDPEFKFLIDGEEKTVYQLKEGTRLTRTALRVQEVSYSE